MTKRNPNLARLPGHYLFLEVANRKKAYLEKYPDAKIISLGIGDTSEPLPECVADDLSQASSKLGTKAGYMGYGPEQGFPKLREKLAERMYQGKVKPEEIFISDGAKCDIGRLQLLFGPDATIAVQDPAYPVYVDGSILNGVQSVHYMSCTPANNFFPDLTKLPKTDLIYFCSPNNPTGATATKEQLKQLIDYAKKHQAVIIYDAAYACFIQDAELPRSIYEIEGAREVAIEVSSFSKLAGFTGVRLGWVVVPDELKYEDGGSIRQDWKRLVSTVFNGASILSQNGGLSVVDDAGWEAIKTNTRHYLGNAQLIRSAMEKLGYKAYGGRNAPYVWVHVPGKNSWQVFQNILENCQVACTPGSGFGPSGEGFVRFSAFGHRENIEEAVERLKSGF